MNTVTVVCLFAVIKFAFADVEKKRPIDIDEFNETIVYNAFKQKKRPIDKDKMVKLNAYANHHNNHMLFQGDIVLTKEQAKFVQMQNKNDDRTKRQAINFKNFPIYRWPTDWPISYTFNSEIAPFARALITQGLNYWQDRTCLTFAENENGVDGLTFINGIGCYSELGKNPTKNWQSISIGQGCYHHGIVVHEIAHALGFLHTQSRYDRDQYVKFYPSRVKAGLEYNFQIFNDFLSANLGMEYDYGSIMHYAATDMGINGSIVLEATNNNTKYQRTMGNRIIPSFSDLLLMNKLYNCLDKCANFPGCKNYGFRNPANCSKCICPSGFGGNDCSELAGPENGATNCGGTFIANSNISTLNGQVGINTPFIINPSMGCHWHIKAPAGKVIEIRATSIEGECKNGCFLGAVEIKHQNYTRSGLRLCCESDIADIGTLVASVNPVIVSAYSMKQTYKFTIEYKAVDA